MENPYAAPQGEIQNTFSDSPPLTWKQIFFSFQGRIPRRQYWAASLIMGLGGALAALIPLALVSMSGASPEERMEAFGPVFGIAMIPVAVLAIWVALAVGIKRWHDRDKSGWWLLIGLIPYLGGIWTFIECGCLRGTEGPNRFGGDPT